MADRLIVRAREQGIALVLVMTVVLALTIVATPFVLSMLLQERSGRGPSYVVVELADGRKRSVRIEATDLIPAGEPASATGQSLPRVSVRTLIPLAQHVNRILSLLTEEVIRDEPSSPFGPSRRVSPTDHRRQDQPVSGVSFAPVAEPIAGDASADRPDFGGAVATDAVDGRRATKRDGPC